MKSDKRDPRLVAEVGKRMRWVREAYEQREPGHHSQKQWAKALDITTSQLSRIESGRQLPPVEVLVDLVYFSGASMDYVFWGVLSVENMAEWLGLALAAAHGPKLRDLQAFQIERERRLRTSALHRSQARPPRKRRAAKRAISP